MQLLPALLVPNQATFETRVRLLETHAPVFHLDIMDGQFVPNQTWWDPEFLKSFETPVKFELHLMVNRPVEYVLETQKHANVFRYIWHVEAPTDHAGLIERVHGLSKEAFLALNPPTSEEALTPIANQADGFLVMGAMPGFSGQILDPAMIPRAKRLRERYPNKTIGFDIGVNEKTLPQLASAGVHHCCLASALFTTPDPVLMYETMKRIVS